VEETWNFWKHVETRGNVLKLFEILEIFGETIRNSVKHTETHGSPEKRAKKRKKWP